MSKKENSFSGWLQRVRRTGEFSDVTVVLVDEDEEEEEEEEEEEFHLHMLPLLNASVYFRSLSGGSSGSTSSNSNNRLVVELKGVPGGAEGFAAAADFCYLIRPCYTLDNVAKIRAVAEHLGMAELLDSTKKFLYMNVFSHWRSSIAFLQQYKRLQAPVDGYVESRCLKVISAACIKAFFDTKYLSAPILSSSSSLGGGAGNPPGSWQNSPCQVLCDALVRVSSLPDVYVQEIVEDLVGGEVNLNLKCRQGRNVQGWLDHTIHAECRTDRARCWVVVCLVRMLEKSVTADRPWLELSSQYWCSLLEHAGLLLRRADAAMAARLQPMIEFLEERIGGSLHELDDYLLTYDFEPRTLLALVQHFRRTEGLSEEEVEEVAAEVDACLWSFVDKASVSAQEFVSFIDAFPSSSRPSHDMLYAGVEKLIAKSGGAFSPEDQQRLWGLVDIAKLSSPCRDQALNNPSYLCQSHVLRYVLQQHNEELTSESSSGGAMGGGGNKDLGHILQKVITANLKLLEENTRRAQEIMELQKQCASLMGGTSKSCFLQSGHSSPDVLLHDHGNGERKASRLSMRGGCVQAIIPDEVEEAPSDTPARRSTCSSSVEY